MSPLGTGLIGCGKIAHVHAGALAALAQSHFLAVCDVDEGRARAFADRYQVPHVFTDVEQMLRAPGLDAVLICTPHPSHAPLVVAAARAGLHVMCEKPISVNLAAADAMIEATRRAGVTFGVIFQRRFWPAARRIRAAIDAGKLGRPILGDCVVKWWRSPDYYRMDPWRGKWATEGGGVLVNQAIHAIDQFLWYMGEVESVYAFCGTQSHPEIEVEDTAVAALRFKNGALGSLECTVCLNPSLHSRVSVHGDNGASVSLTEQPESSVGLNDVWTIPGEEVDAAGWRQAESGLSVFPHYHHLQIEEFLQAVSERRDPAVGGEDARRSIALVMAIYESARTGQPVAPST